ncbi:hypothetical protein SAY87_028612 [Trapa incisa]|uniref:Uncharacterized protein n=1 Tax=Trapa incisa TaxID=236973 RepID=A0AAN7KPH9_9MYRT|nr:hypothetical protein SAY87_028612 [Trapa incisa]
MWKSVCLLCFWQALDLEKLLQGLINNTTEASLLGLLFGAGTSAYQVTRLLTLYLTHVDLKNPFSSGMSYRGLHETGMVEDVHLMVEMGLDAYLNFVLSDGREAINPKGFTTKATSWRS